MEQFIHVMAWVGLVWTAILAALLLTVASLWSYKALFEWLTPAWFFWCTVCIIHAKTHQGDSRSWGFFELADAMKAIKLDAPLFWQNLKDEVDSDKVKEEDEL